MQQEAKLIRLLIVDEGFHKAEKITSSLRRLAFRFCLKASPINGTSAAPGTAPSSSLVIFFMSPPITTTWPLIKFDQAGATCNIIVRDYNETTQLQEAFAGSKLLEMKEAQQDKVAKGVDGTNPRVLIQQRFTFRERAEDE